MSDGWVKLWRQSLDRGWLKNGDLWRFWCYCLMRAAHTPRKQMVGYQVVHLLPGQFVFGREKASLDLDMSIGKVRSCLWSLSKRGNLTIKSTNKFSIITIMNWEVYQSEDSPANHQINQPVTSNQPATNQQVTSNQPASNHKQELKNVRIKEENNIPSFSSPSATVGRLKKPASGRKASTDDWVKALGNGLRTWFEEEWWPEQIRKVGKKECAMAVYDLNPDVDKRAAIMASYKRQKENDLSRRDPSKVPHPATWINGSRWEDEACEFAPRSDWEITMERIRNEIDNE